MSDTVVEGLSIDDVIALIDQELGEPSLPRPEGFGVTVREYMQKKGCSETQARKMLDAMVEKGLFDRKVMVDGRGTAPMVYYPKGAYDALERNE